MIALTSKMTMDSELLPGARVHLKKFSVERRARVVIALAEYRAKLNEIYRQMFDFIVVPDETDETGKVIKPGDPPELRERKIIERVRLQGEITALEDAYLKPVQLREYVVSIEGVELDGEPMTPETLLSGGHPAFADEIYTWMEGHNGLPPFGGTSSSSPSPSPTPEAGTSPSTIASAA